MKNFQYYRSIGLLRVNHDGSYDCLICDLGIISPSHHFRKYHPEYYMDPNEIRDLTSVKVKVRVDP